MLTAVAERLNAFGVQWEQLHRLPSAAGVQHWQLTAVESEVPGAGLDVRQDDLRSIPGVVDLIVYDNIAPLAANNGKIAGAKRGVEVAHRVVDHSVREMTAVFPAIRSAMREFERRSKYYGSRYDMSMHLGLQLGRRLALRHRRIHSVASVEEALQKVVVGMLFPLVRGQVQHSQLRVEAGDFLVHNLFSVDQVKRRIFSEPPLRCVFLSGLLSGLLNHAEQLPNIKVDVVAERESKQFAWVFCVNVV